MHIRAVTHEQEFNSVKDEWIHFEKKVNNKNITSSYFWQRAWWKHFGHINNDQYGYDKKLFILFFYNDEEELRAIAPFCTVSRRFKKIFHYTVIEFLAQQWGATYLDIISEGLLKNEVDYIFGWISRNKKYDLIDLSYIPESTSVFNLIDENATVLSGCPEIQGKNYLDVREKFYSKHLRLKLNGIKNKILRDKVDLKSTIVKGETILHLMNRIFFISESKKFSGKHSIYLEPAKKSFVKDIISDFSEGSYCTVILFNKKLCAYHSGFSYNNAFFAFDTSYDRNTDELKKYSVGIIAEDEQVKEAFSRGTNHFCFGTGIDFHKLGFTKKIRKIYSVVYKGNTIKSEMVYKKKLSISKRIQKYFLEELYKKIPQGKWS